MINVDIESLKNIFDSVDNVEAAYLFGSAAKHEEVVNDLDFYL